MTLEELKREKEKLQNRILNLIKEFEDNNPFYVADIDIGYSETIEGIKRTVCVKIRLEA